MGGQYSIDVAGFLSTTDAVATELEVLAEAVASGVRDLDRLTDLVAVEPGLGDALQSASGERRRTGPGAVRHGGDVVMAAGRVALAYVQADDDMADSTSRADVGTPSPRAPGVVRFGRGWR